MNRVLVDCATKTDDLGRVVAPSSRMLTLTQPEQTAYDDQQTVGRAQEQARLDAETARASDMEGVRQRALLGDADFARIYRILGGRGATS